jgi:hypothetical protein
LLTALALAAMSCGHAAPVRPSPRFRDHTRPRLASIADFEALSAPGAGKLHAVKFVIDGFDSDQRSPHFLDGNFYTFHDEWLWYQTLNGIPVGDHEALQGPGFESPQDATAWAVRQPELPLDLEMYGDRLYSDAFYDRALADDRSFGVGALVRVQASEGHPEVWGFELEYTDLPEREHVETIHAELRKVLPAEIARDLRWLTRSVAQAKLATRLRAQRSHVATLDYAELASSGESEVYSAGARIGRLRLLESGRSAIDQATEYDVLVVPAPLDDLPPVAGIISLVPLTPLSHFNVLARQRGIPCVYVGGVDTDPYLGTLIRAQAPVLLDARSDGVWIAPMSDRELAAAIRPARFVVQQPQLADPRSMPYVRALDELQRDPSRAALQEVGGKMLGFVTLAALDPADRPAPVAAITARAYAEHVEPLVPLLRAMLQDPSFLKSPRLRLLALEGPEVFEREYPSARDRAWAQRLKQGDRALAQVIAHDGVQAMIRARALQPEALRVIREQLGAAMSGISRSQGLRLRSSSTLEDIEGFNGAGLYDSSTGYLDREGKKSLEAGIKNTWASYWTYRAFEERRRAGLSSLHGRMAIVVHPRFDDAQELGNAVVTFTLFPPSTALIASMEVNAQLGSLSVTNPPVDNPDALPEVTRITLSRAESVPRITRIRPSTEVAAGQLVFSDADLVSMLDKLRPLAQRWLELHDTDIDPAARPRMATLDLELRRMAPDWPAGSPHTRSEPRWIIKQVRSLEPPAEIPGIAELELQIPRDVLVRSVKIVRRTCKREGFSAELIEAYTGAELDPDLGFAKNPFIASLMLTAQGQSTVLTHLDLAHVIDRSHLELSPQAATELGMPIVDLSGARCEEHVEVADQSELLRTISKRAKRLGRPAGESGRAIDNASSL